ncbi:MAG: hypothetical protein KJ737_02000 [Proteobacteria bacterium]|nr:hypothetical protein [Pseudomonadota bacterium]
MKPLHVRHTIFFMALAFILCSSGSVFAVEKWEKAAKTYFENGEYEKCIELVKNNKDDKFARMFLAFSHLQEYTFNKTKYDKEMFKNAMMILKDKTGSEDMDHLLYFVNQKDQPPVVKEARNLLTAAFKNCKENDDVKKLLPLLNSSDDKTKEATLKTIKNIIDPKRKVVTKGGTLRKQDVDMMTDPALIKALFDNILVSGTASKILVMIEKPALKYISEYEGKKVMELETKITKAIAKREKKYPESNWYSATGKTRE